MVVILCKVFYQIKVISLISNYLFLIAIMNMQLKILILKQTRDLKYLKQLLQM